jgi:hypothetical protein
MISSFLVLTFGPSTGCSGNVTRWGVACRRFLDRVVDGTSLFLTRIDEQLVGRDGNALNRNQMVIQSISLGGRRKSE